MVRLAGASCDYLGRVIVIWKLEGGVLDFGHMDAFKFWPI